MLPARDQGREGTCVGFATAAAREAFLDTDAIPLSPRFLYQHCKERDGLPAEGTFLRVAMQILKDAGICAEKKWPYTPYHTGQPEESADSEAQQHAIGSFVRLDAKDHKATLMNIKHHLNHHGPLVLGIWVFEGWLKPSAMNTGMVPHPKRPERRLGGHAVCIVGYDDQEQRFCFKNSWGAEWGDKGHGYLSYDYLRSFCIEAWGLFLREKDHHG